MKEILNIMECTVILHNFLIEESEGDMPEEWLCEDDIDQFENDDELNLGVPLERPNNTRQMQLMAYINELLYYPTALLIYCFINKLRY